MLRRAALLWLLPSVALAQTQTAASGQVTITESSDADSFVNLAECQGSADNLTLTWQVADSSKLPPTTVPANTPVKLTISADSGCPPTTTTVWRPAADPDAGGSASGTYPVAGTSLPVTTVLTALKLGSCATQRTTLWACAAMTIGAITYTAQGSIILDTQLPPAPTLDAVAAGDSALNASFTPGTPGGATPAANDHYMARATGPDGATHDSKTTTSTSARIDGLTNGVVYDVVVFAYNAAGNQSAQSNTRAGSPEPVIDFWQAYKAAGGREQGGCGAGPAGALAPLLALLALALRRRLS